MLYVVQCVQYVQCSVVYSVGICIVPYCMYRTYMCAFHISTIEDYSLSTVLFTYSLLRTLHSYLLPLTRAHLHLTPYTLVTLYRPPLPWTLVRGPMSDKAPQSPYPDPFLSYSP